MAQLRDFYEGWTPKAIRAEPPSTEQAAAFLNKVRRLPPWQAAFWIGRLSLAHKDRLSHAYKFVIDTIHVGCVDSPYHMTAMLSSEERRAFNVLYSHEDKDLLFTAAAVLCIRERFMLATTIFNSLKGT